MWTTWSSSSCWSSSCWSSTKLERDVAAGRVVGPALDDVSPEGVTTADGPPVEPLAVEATVVDALAAEAPPLEAPAVGATAAEVPPAAESLPPAPM